MKGIYLSIVIPVYNSESSLETLVSQINKVCETTFQPFEIILVDDGSSDGSWTLMKSLSVTSPHILNIRFSRNFGQQKAILAGLESSRGEFVVVMDADLQDSPREILRFLQESSNSGCEVILAKRVKKQHGVAKRMGSFGFYWLVKKFTGVNHSHAVGNFGLYTKNVVEKVRLINPQDFLFVFAVAWCGFSTSFVDVKHGQRFSGRSSYSLRKLFRLANSIIISNTSWLLKKIIHLGLGLSIGSLAAGLFLIWQYLNNSFQVEGWTSVIVTLLFTSGALMSSIGVVGIYLDKVFQFSKGVPHFVVEEVYRVE